MSICLEGDSMNKEYNLFSLTKYNANVNPDKTIPTHVKLKNKQMWCPYCSCPVIFLKDKEFNVRECPLCGISDRDYYVKLVNKMWK